MSRTAAVSCDECDARVLAGDAYCTGCGVAVSDGVRAALEARRLELAEFEEEVSGDTRDRLSEGGIKLRFATAAVALLALAHGALALADAANMAEAVRPILGQLEGLAPGAIVTTPDGVRDTVESHRRNLEAWPFLVLVQHVEIAALLLALFVRGRSAALAMPVVAFAVYVALQLTTWDMGFAIVRWFGALVLFAGARAALEFGKSAPSAAPPASEEHETDVVECLQCGCANRMRSRFCADCGDRLTERAPVSIRKSKRAVEPPGEAAAPQLAPSLLKGPAALVIGMSAIGLLASRALEAQTAGQVVLAWSLELLFALVWVALTRDRPAESGAQLGWRAAPFVLGSAVCLAALNFGQNALASTFHFPEPILVWLTSKGWSLAAAGGVVLAAITIDEIAFRGYVTDRLERAGARRHTVLFQAVLYAAVWPGSQIWQGFLVGFVMGQLRRATGRVLPCIVAQAIALVAFAALSP